MKTMEHTLHNNNNKIMSSFAFPSVFIPRVSGQNDEAYIENIFWAYFGGEESPISRIDLIMKEDNRTGHMYQIAFVHFMAMTNPSAEVMELAAKLDSAESVKFVHSYPWYWILRKNTSKPKETRPRVLSEADEAEIKKAQQVLMSKKSELTIP